MSSTLYAHHILPVILANIGIGKALAHKRAIRAYCHICNMQIAHQIVGLAALAQFAFVEIGHEFILDVSQTALNIIREEDKHQQ